MRKSNSTLARPSFSQTVEVKGLNGLMGNLNSDVKHLIQQGSTYNFYGKNNQIILNEPTAEAVYADTQPDPIRHPSFLEGWYYVNENAGDKFNYYFFSNTTFSLPASSVKGQFAIFENQAITTENVNVLLAIYLGDFFTGGRQVYTSNKRMEIGVKYLVYWGEDPEIFPELPRIEYTLASERNWDDTQDVLTMSVGSDSGYTAGTVNNLMTHMGYVTEDGPVITTLIGSIDNVNPTSQLGLGLNEINNNIDLVNTNLGVLAQLLEELITLQGGGDNGGENGGGGVELTSIIPDTDPSGTTSLSGGGLTTFTWEFTTTTATQYDLYALTNGFVTGDDEKIFTMYLSNDVDETTILDPSIFISKNDNQITMNLPAGESDYVINFSDSMSGETAQAEITLQPNTTYTFKCSTLFNDDDTTNADIRFAITEALSTDSLVLNYVSGVSDVSGETGTTMP